MQKDATDFMEKNRKKVASGEVNHIMLHTCPTATAFGRLPTGMEVMMVLVMVLMTDTLLLRLLGTYTFLPSGVRSASLGEFPTPFVMVVMTVLNVGESGSASMTEIILSPEFSTKTLVPTGVRPIPTPAGPTPTCMVMTVLVAVSMTETVSSSAFVT